MFASVDVFIVMIEGNFKSPDNLGNFRVYIQCVILEDWIDFDRNYSTKNRRMYISYLKKQVFRQQTSLPVTF